MSAIKDKTFTCDACKQDLPIRDLGARGGGISCCADCYAEAAWSVEATS